MSHTPEPWDIGRYPPGADVTSLVIVKDLPTGTAVPLATVRETGIGYVDLPSAENAERIVACVNALEGWEDPADVGRLVTAADMALKVWGKYVDSQPAHMYRGHQVVLDALRAALERAP